SDMLLGQFVDNFRVAAAARPVPKAPPAEATAIPVEPAAAAAASAPASVPAPAPVSEINALAIFWQLLKGWVAGLFGKRA
ncbi:MAG: carbon monoxide dehydrogenase, partial [Rhizobacter sp.]